MKYMKINKDLQKHKEKLHLEEHKLMHSMINTSFSLEQSVKCIQRALLVFFLEFENFFKKYMKSRTRGNVLLLQKLLYDVRC